MVKVIVGFFLGMVLVGCSPKEPTLPVTVPAQEMPQPPLEPKKPLAIHPHCAKHKEAAEHAYSYIMEEFEEAYFSTKDFRGANAQLFLITAGAQTAFAQNINAAQETYEKQYALAKSLHCNLSTFPASPLEALRKKINTAIP